MARVAHLGIYLMIQSLSQHFTAFVGQRQLASGQLAEVAVAVMATSKRHVTEPIVIFDDASGRPIDLDLRGSEHDVVARLPPQPAPNSESAMDDLAVPEPRGRGSGTAR